MAESNVNGRTQWQWYAHKNYNSNFSVRSYSHKLNEFKKSEILKINIYNILWFRTTNLDNDLKLLQTVFNLTYSSMIFIALKYLR